VQTYKTYLKIPFVLVVARSNSQGIFTFKILMEKKCTKCGEVKSLDAFYNNKNGKHGKMSRCKDCDKLYYQDNRERQLENAKEYRENNKEKIAKYSKAYRENNKEAISEYKLKYNVENKKYLQDYHSSYRQINKKKCS